MNYQIIIKFLFKGTLQAKNAIVFKMEAFFKIMRHIIFGLAHAPSNNLTNVQANDKLIIGIKSVCWGFKQLNKEWYLEQECVSKSWYPSVFWRKCIFCTKKKHNPGVVLPTLCWWDNCYFILLYAFIFKLQKLKYM